MLDPERRFNIYRRDRQHRPGGGTTAMISNSIKSYEYDLNYDECNIVNACGCDVLCVDVLVQKFKYRLITVYRPPSSCFGDKSDLLMKTSLLTDLVTRLTHPTATTILLGDFNLPGINWSSLEMPIDGVHDSIYNCLTGLGYFQFVNDVTRLSITGNSHILDLIFCTDEIAINVDSITAPLGTSDHSIIHFQIFTAFDQTSTPGINSTLPQNNEHKINLPVYDWSSADYSAINDAIHSVDWHVLFGQNFDANSIWRELKNILWPIISLFVPQKLVNHLRKYRPRAYPKHIRKLLTRKAAIWRKLKLSNTPDLAAKYRNIAIECKNEILKFDTENEEKLLKANNLGAFYRFVNKKLSNHSGIAPLKSVDGSLVTDDDDRANLLNSYFESVFTHDDGSTPSFPSRLPDNTHVSDINTSLQTIHRILKKLKTNSAAGPDGLPPIFYHHTAPSMSFPLSIFFRTLIETRSIPDEWRVAIITPIFKKGSPSDPTNYRPVSLTCTCCKILESIITSEILNFLNQPHLITKHQHGFLSRHSTSTNLLECINDWTLSISNKKSIPIAYIDFKSAFDCISHPKLLLKLSSYGIKGNLYFWIQSFLSNRSQFVKINSSYSLPCPVSSGVIQGSVVGSLLFNLFINDITDHFHHDTTIKLFADDIKLYTDYTVLSHNNIQHNLNLIHTWSSIWQMRISYSKCNILHIGSIKHPHSYNIDDNIIATVDCHRSRGNS